MQPATYRFSESFIRSKVRGPIWGAAAFSAFVALVVTGMSLDGDWNPIVSVCVVALASTAMFIRNFKRSREAASDLSQAVIEVSDDSLCFIEPGSRHIITTNSITSVIVDQRAQEPRVIYLQFAAGPTVQLEGLNGMGQLAQQLTRIVGAAKQRELKWWQFPPR